MHVAMCYVKNGTLVLGRVGYLPTKRGGDRPGPDFLLENGVGSTISYELLRFTRRKLCFAFLDIKFQCLEFIRSVKLYQFRDQN